MEWGVYFIVALLLSFLGSLPIGLITLNISQSTIQHGRQSGISLSLGATVMEFVYTYLALISLEFFTQNTGINQYIKVAATFVFLGMGSYFLFKKTTTNLRPVQAGSYFDFFRGILVGAMNMLIIPFWIFLALWLQSQGLFFERTDQILFFSLGSALGALIAFVGYVGLSEYIMKRLATVNRYTDKVVGWLFIGLGVFQLWQLL